MRSLAYINGRSSTTSIWVLTRVSLSNHFAINAGSQHETRHETALQFHIRNRSFRHDGRAQSTSQRVLRLALSKPNPLAIVDPVSLKVVATAPGRA